MRREKLQTFLTAAFLALCVSFGGVAGMVTGFSMDTAGWEWRNAVDLTGLLIFCLAFSLGAAACFSFRRGGWVLAGAGALILGFLWRAGVLEPSVEALLYRISTVYDHGYGWGFLAWTGADPQVGTAEPALCLIAAVTSVLTAWTVCRRSRAFAAVAVGFLPLIACLVVTDTVPDSWCLFLLLAGQVPLILTNTVRRRSAPDGNRLTALLLVPSVLVTALLFWAVPRDGYAYQSSAVQDRILGWLQGLPFVQSGPEGPVGIGSGSSDKVDLTAVGPQAKLTYPVMDVTAPLNGALYLRGQGLDAYDGESWDTSDYSSDTVSFWPSGQALGTVTVRTYSTHSVQYVPYDPPTVAYWDHIFTEGRLKNPERLKEYSFTMILPGAEKQTLEYAQSQQCLMLPWETRSRALAHLERLPVDVLAAPAYLTAEAVGDYVRNSAEYDLNTPAMPRSETDFAMWFLEESDTGYCVHFASAAAVLLRAAGIPARYVTGYICSARDGDTVTVTADLAHAWVEYYDPDGGWKILDPTPPIGAEDPRYPTASVPTTQPTEPTETTEPTEQTGATLPSRPDVTRPTVPDGTEPGGNTQQPEEKPDLRWLWTVGKVLLWIAAACLVIMGQYLLRLGLRRKRMRTGSVNARALAKWREAQRLHRLLRTEPPEELLRLAEKAKFSQHTLAVEERQRFDRHLTVLSGELAKLPPLRRTLLRLVWAVK